MLNSVLDPSRLALAPLIAALDDRRSNTTVIQRSAAGATKNLILPF
jgi:hypothetical protein